MKYIIRLFKLIGKMILGPVALVTFIVGIFVWVLISPVVYIIKGMEGFKDRWEDDNVFFVEWADKVYSLIEL